VYTCNKARLAAEIFHVHIKDHVTADLLVGWRNLFFSIQNIECNSDILHLLHYRILPKSVVLFFFKPQTVIPSFGNFNSKLVSALMVMLCYSCNNSSALLENMWSPPHKIRGINQDICNCILRNFNWVALLEIRQALPPCCPIFPFNTQVPTLGCFPHLCVATMLDVHISRLKGITICLVVNNAFYQVVLPALNITLGIHIRCNHIGGIFITVAIRKLNFINPGAQH
jgi:hypothetical protein